MTGTIDNYLSGRGDFIDGCSKRLFWAGSTSIRGTGEILKLSSRARYEQWKCIRILGKEVKTRLFRDTKTVHWELSFDREAYDSQIQGRSRVSPLGPEVGFVCSWG